MTTTTTQHLIHLLFIFSILHVSLGARRLTESDQDSSNEFISYHGGPLLTGNISVNFIWYGNFKPSQKAIITDFITSLHDTSPTNPSVARWWRTTDNYYHEEFPKPANLRLGKQVSDESYSLGKSLTEQNLVQLASRGESHHAVNIVLTASDVTIDGFCSSRCGTHGTASGTTSGPASVPKTRHNKDKNYKFAYIWVGNSETQCPGQCAWPFHQPIYGPQAAPLVAPNNDVGVDGMVISLGGLLAGTATNLFGNGFYQGDAGAPLEAASACPGVFAKGAYPGYAGDLLVDPTTGASYNAHGTNRRKYLLPALFDMLGLYCVTLI